LSKEIIAIVDDEPRVREALEDLLQAAAYQVRCFGSGEEFLASGALMEADCLISDIQMHRVSGWDLLRIALASRPRMPVVLITGRLNETAELLQPRGQRFFFEKPVDGRALLNALREVLRAESTI
jgi:two-component system response regulator FixJ